MLNPGTPQNARNHEELNKFLINIVNFPEGFEALTFKKISEFLKDEKSVGIDGKDFALIIKSAKFKDCWDRMKSIDNFLSSDRDRSLGITANEFVELIKVVEPSDDSLRLRLITMILESQRSVRIASKDFVEIFKSAGFIDDIKVHPSSQTNFFLHDRSNPR